MVDINDIVELEIKKEWVEEAEINSEKMGVLKNSITKGDGNLAAFIGEIAVSEYLGYKRTNIHLDKNDEDENIYHYDMFDKKERKVEVKTKRCTSIPLPEYATSVCNDNIYQQCDYYLFTRVDIKRNTVWLLGWLEKLDYYKNSVYCIKNEKDPDRTNFKFVRNCWNRYIYDLNKISDLENVTLLEDHTDWNKIKKQLNQIVSPKRIESMSRKLERIQKDKDDTSKKLSKMKDDWFDEEAKRQKNMENENIWGLTLEEIKQFSDIIMKNENKGNIS